MQFTEQQREEIRQIVTAELKVLLGGKGKPRQELARTIREELAKELLYQGVRLQESAGNSDFPMPVEESV